MRILCVDGRAFARISLHYCFAGSAALIVCTAAAQEWRPNKNVDIVVNSAPGGVADRQARVAQKFLQSLPGIPSVSVTNRAGGGGSVALTFLTQHPGDAHSLCILSTALLTNQIVGASSIRYQDLTPLNILLREYIVVAVKADSPLASGRDLAARLKKDPASVSFAFSTARGNQNHVVIGMLAKAAGVDPKVVKTVIFASGGPAVTATLGGHVDVYVGTPGTALPHLQSGRFRILGISSAQRQTGRLAAVPTFREQGVDAIYYSWRGFIGPKGLTPAQIAYWDQAFAKVIQSEDWKKDLEENAWVEDYLNSAETRKHLDAEYEMLGRMLLDLGVIARQERPASGKPPAN
jgi:putative tricarboxylic transport membrane protein